MKKLTVENFKSIRRLELECRRVNIFIGEPNTGKSNILEALGLLSFMWHEHGTGNAKKAGEAANLRENARAIRHTPQLRPRGPYQHLYR